MTSATAMTATNGATLPRSCRMRSPTSVPIDDLDGPGREGACPGDAEQGDVAHVGGAPDVDADGSAGSELRGVDLDDELTADEAAVGQVGADGLLGRRHC